MSRPYTPEMAVDLRVPSEIRLSPDGSHVLYRVEPIGHRTSARTSTIFVVPADGSGFPRALTGSNHNNTAATWSPDGSNVAFLSDRAQQGTQQLHVVPVGGGEPLGLTQIDGGVSSPTFAPDGRSIAFTARRKALAGEPDLPQEIRLESTLARPRGLAQVPVTGGPPEVIGPRDCHVWGFAWSPDGATIAALISDTDALADAWDNVRLVVCAVDGTGQRELLRLCSFPGTPLWSDDGRRIAVIGAQVSQRDATNVIVVDVASGAVTIIDDRDMTPNAALFVGDDLLVHSVEIQRTRIDRGVADSPEWEQLSLGPALADAWVEARAGWDVRNGMIAVAGAFPDHPANIYAGPLGGDLVCLTDLNPQIRGVDLSDMESIEWMASDGMVIHGWLMLPPGSDLNACYPLVAAIHGGPTWQWGNWFHGTWHDWGQILTAAGYAVFMPNPRGSTGRGRAFTGINRFDFGGGDFDDIMTGIDMLIERGVADPDRLGICGWSFGGFMAAWAIGHTDRFKASVAGAACTNWVSKIGTTDIRPYDEWDVGVVNADPDRPWFHSPLRYAGKGTTPTLVLHGQADVRVPVTQGTELYHSVKASGTDAEMASYPRQGHAFHERAFELDLLQRLVGWFDRYLDPDVETRDS
ncbi:MAG: S9 family peptidase [Thermomicrobiales bacterium]|nr:S9 family peptidase [Thermomicrobiales bacterium]